MGQNQSLHGVRSKGETMVRKILTAIACILIMSGNAHAESSWERVQRIGKLVVGLEEQYPPLAFRDKDGSLTGFDIDAARILTKRLGVSIELRPTSWEKIIYKLDAREFDCIWTGMTITEKRAKALLFTRPYMVANHMAYVRNGDDRFSSYKDLKEKVIGAQKETTSAEAAYDLLDPLRVLEYPDILQGFENLENEKIDAFIVENVVGNAIMERQPGKFKPLEGQLTKEPFGIAFRKSDIALRDKIQKELDAMLEDGTLGELSMKWFGRDLTAPENW